MSPFLTIWAAHLMAAADPARIDAVFAAYHRTDSPGCAVSVSQDGKVAFARGYGMAELDHDLAITPESVFHVASVSKQFTAAAAVLLALDGKLSLDDPVSKHIAGFPKFAGTPITLRHLIHHVSGLRDQWNLLVLTGWRLSEDVVRDEDVMRLISMQRDLNFPPGEEHLYSNTGYTVLAQVVKQVSGKSLREFTRERIFEPLGMRKSFFRDDYREVVKGMAYGYVPRNRGGFQLSIPTYDTTGASSLLTTTGDLLRWDAELRDPKVLGTKWREQMEQPFTLNNGEKTAYRFGLVSAKHQGRAILEHSGGDAGYRSHLLQFPNDGVSVAVLCNTAAAPGRLARQVANLILGLAEEPAPKPQVVALSPAELEKFTGLYWNPDDEEIYRVAAKDGGLRMKLGMQYFAMTAMGGGRFLIPGQGITAEFEENGATLSGPGGKPERVRKVVEVAPGTAELAAFAGSYYSPELDTTYKLELKDGKMVLHRPKLRTHDVEPTFRDSFYAPFLGFLRFERDASGKPGGFRLTSGRIRHLRFERR